MPVIGSDAALVKFSVQYLRGSDESFTVHWYRSSVAPDDVDQADIRGDFAQLVLVPLANLIISQWDINNITVDVVNGNQAPTTADSGVGLGAIVGQAPMPNFAAFPVRLIRTTKETRSGYKRFPGMSEEMVSADVFEAATVTAWEAYVPVLASNFTDDDTNVWSPVIVRTSVLGVPIENPADYVYNPISGAVFVNRVTTQNSRKRF